MHGTYGRIALGISMTVLTACASAHEGDGDTSVPEHDGGPPVSDAAVFDGGHATPCGPTTCAVGLVCCNASCGICTEPGVGCIDLECADAGTERRCGGIRSATCRPDEYCDYRGAASCEADDAEGLCTPRPPNCPDPGGSPVCGCDGTDYLGECAAYLSGTDVAHAGRCHPTMPPASVSAVRSCGPTDGPAWTFMLSNDNPPACASSDHTATRITLWGDLSSVGADHVFHLTSTGSSEGVARSCPGGLGAPCLAFAGTVTVHAFVADDRATISYDLHATTTDVHADLVADDVSVDVWCAEAPICG
jgi:hypothetical protein